jgi:hypothetical protein
MKAVTLGVPEIAGIAVTRAILGIGIGLWLSDKLGPNQRRNLSWTCIATGVLTTIPAAIRVFGSES